MMIYTNANFLCRDIFYSHGKIDRYYCKNNHNLCDEYTNEGCIIPDTKL